MKKILIALMTCICISLFPACFDEVETEDGTTYKIIFVQSGEKDIVKSVNIGEILDSAEVPEPKDKEGYTVCWDITDFSNVTESITVTAIATPNNYTITYYITDKGAVISTENQEVTYDSSFVLQTPSAPYMNYKFKNWVIKNTETVFSSGVWELTNDVELEAVWSEEKEWSDFH